MGTRFWVPLLKGGAPGFWVLPHKGGGTNY
jgi:hypothetical protein